MRVTTRLTPMNIVSGMVTRIGPKKPFRLYIAERRIKAGLTQEQLATRIDSTKASISRWETGERDPQSKVLAAIADALDIQISQLFIDPLRPSADALLALESNSRVRKAVKLVETFLEKEQATGTEG